MNYDEIIAMLFLVKTVLFHVFLKKEYLEIIFIYLIILILGQTKKCFFEHN